jgi:voltage-dependent calcium channel L type alpha-1D
MITFFIAFNTIVMAIKFDGMSPDFENTLDKLNYLFAGIFNMEMYMKLIGLGTQYFYSAWNLFDMTVVIGTDVGLILEFTTDGSGFSTAATVVRAFRIMRIVRLVRSQPSIKIILDTVVNIIPQISNFITLLFLLLFIFSALGINLFGGCVY